ncbi:MAG: recombination protein RecR [Candidatus Caldatribacterium sp.]|nr:recombination protein RecR [Candidatus Caldatribacterium sp.]
MQEAYPESLDRVIRALSKLPGIGPKTAQRLAFYLVKSPSGELEELLRALEDMRRRIRFCKKCGFFSEEELCRICQDPSRETHTLCVVERPQDIFALERAGFRGRYHVLQGVLSPLSGIGPQDIRIPELFERIQEEAVKEVILALNPSVDGEATALYLAQKLSTFPVKVTLIARGLPSGGDLEFADEVTLAQALEGRREIRFGPGKEAL